jgi:hypothetical protein
MAIAPASCANYVSSERSSVAWEKSFVRSEHSIQAVFPFVDADRTREQTFSTQAPSSQGGSAEPRDSTGVRRATEEWLSPLRWLPMAVVAATERF